MAPDVPFAESAQEGVTDSVEKNIGVGMSQETPFERDLDAPEDQRPTRREAVTIVSRSCPDHHISPHRFKMYSPRRRSSRVVIFIFSQAPGTIRTGWPVLSTREDSSVP